MKLNIKQHINWELNNGYRIRFQKSNQNDSFERKGNEPKLNKTKEKEGKGRNPPAPHAPIKSSKIPIVLLLTIQSSSTTRHFPNDIIHILAAHHFPIIQTHPSYISLLSQLNKIVNFFPLNRGENFVIKCTGIDSIWWHVSYRATCPLSTWIGCLLSPDYCRVYVRISLAEMPTSWVLGLELIYRGRSGWRGSLSLLWVRTCQGLSPWVWVWTLRSFSLFLLPFYLWFCVCVKNLCDLFV